MCKCVIVIRLGSKSSVNWLPETLQRFTHRCYAGGKWKKIAVATCVGNNSIHIDVFTKGSAVVY